MSEAASVKDETVMRVTQVRRAAFLLVALTLATGGLPAQQAERARVVASIDSIAKAALKGGRAAGMSIAVVIGRDTLVMKGYGYADLEYNYPTPPRAVYELGSVTKQFTAAAILQLQEAEKLALDDPVSKHLPNFPLKGHQLTVRRLMDHTSGIKGYTEIPKFFAIMQRKLPRDSLVELFANEPWDFDPGEAMIYNNSAYFLLGLIIEKASGQSYAEYVQKNLFARAGMADSRYCSENEIVKNMTHGYDAGPKGLVKAAYIDQTWPFSAGSLCSTAGDLVAWNRALHGGKILSAESYRELITPGKLNDGTPMRYAKGIAVADVLGHRAIHHDGAIPGFLAASAYLPDDDLIVVVLINTLGPVSPVDVSKQIIKRMVGDRRPTYVKLDHPLADYAGSYSGKGRGQSLVMTVVQDSTGLRFMAGPGAGRTAGYLGNDVFDVENALAYFVREGGVVKGLKLDQTGSLYVLNKQ
jgi:CubicO group peptidase (beta-lactamase class C family)